MNFDLFCLIIFAFKIKETSQNRKIKVKLFVVYLIIKIRCKFFVELLNLIQVNGKNIRFREIVILLFDAFIHR